MNLTRERDELKAMLQQLRERCAELSISTMKIFAANTYIRELEDVTDQLADMANGE